MRAVLEALRGLGRASTFQLCRAAFCAPTGAALGSTRRALRALVRRGVVVALGRNLGGECVYALSSQKETYSCPWADGEAAAEFAALYGEQHATFARRLFYSKRLSPQQRVRGRGVSIFET